SKRRGSSRPGDISSASASASASAQCQCSFSYASVITMFFRKAASVVALAATTAALADKRDDCNADTAPQQIRLAYAGDHGMTVSWNTNQMLTNPTVDFGLRTDHLERSASSDISITYPTSS